MNGDGNGDARPGLSRLLPPFPDAGGFCLFLRTKVPKKRTNKTAHVARRRQKAAGLKKGASQAARLEKGDPCDDKKEEGKKVNLGPKAECLPILASFFWPRSYWKDKALPVVWKIKHNRPRRRARRLPDVCSKRGKKWQTHKFGLDVRKEHKLGETHIVTPRNLSRMSAAAPETVQPPQSGPEFSWLAWRKEGKVFLCYFL